MGHEFYGDQRISDLRQGRNSRSVPGDDLREDCADETPRTPVSLALEEIKASLGVIQDECENYGGWAGGDDEAKVAMDLGMDLLSLGFVVGLHGREHAEGGAPGA